MLIMKGAKVDALDKCGQTPLYLAAKCDNYLDVVTLVEEGGADIFKTNFKDQQGAKNFKTDGDIFDVAKSADILKFLFSKTTVDQLLTVDKNIKLFDKVVDRHPTLIEPFLNIFVTPSEKVDLDDPKVKFEYNLSLFTTDPKEKHEGRKTYNMMHRHLKLIDTNHPDMLLHPVMRAFTDLKWMQYLKLFLATVFFTFMFLACFTWYGMWYVDMTQCEPINLGNISEDKLVESNCAKGFKGILICTNEDDKEIAKDKGHVENRTISCDQQLKTCRSVVSMCYD